MEMTTKNIYHNQLHQLIVKEVEALISIINRAKLIQTNNKC